MLDDIGRHGDGSVIAHGIDTVMAPSPWRPFALFCYVCFVLSGEYHCNLYVCTLLKPPRAGSVIDIANVPQLW